MQPWQKPLFKQHRARRLFVSIALFILIEGSFSFCSKTTCPAFADAAFDSWFPYQVNQALFFTSATTEKDTITISSTYRSPEHKEYGRAINCNAWTSVSSFVTATTPRFYITYNISPEGNSLSVQLNDFRVSEATLSEEQITVTDNSAISSMLSGVVIAGKTFGSVMQLQRDTTAIKSAGIYKMWFSKGIGLVGYEQYPTLEQWAKD
jgi:hypothetical protein